MLDRVDELLCVVRDACQPKRIVGDGTDETKPRDPHVLHRANRCADVDGVLRLE